MSINVGPLSLAGAESSKNALITGLLAEIAVYNGMGASQKKPKSDALVRVMKCAGWYLTSKPPQPKFKNKRRWAACLAVAEEAGKEADALGVRMLSGPKDFKKIDAAHASYWLEYLDPQHRPGYVLAPNWQAWLTDAAAVAAKQSFWAHIGTILAPADIDVLVKYYPESPVYDNLDYLLHFVGTTLTDALDVTFDSRTNTTHFSDVGWAIFVVSPENKFFAGSHEVGKHHHSSFLGGGAVLAAGEIVVDDGKVCVLTAKSGHYRPSPQNLRNFVLQERNIPDRAAIRPDLRDIAKHGEVRFYSCGDYRAQGEAATRLTKPQLLGRLPPFARSGQFRTSTFVHVPS
ncbi:MAG: hypothetical protein ACR2P1_04210 [Pseudomonadales bacterium]